MPGLKEGLQVQTQETILAAEQAGFSFRDNFRVMTKWKRVMILAILIALVPGYLLARFGTEQLLRLQYARQALVAHPGFSTSTDPVIGAVTLIKNPTGNWSAYALVTNPNLDLATETLGYTMTFENGNGREVYSTTGTTYLLPNEKRYIVVPRIESTEQLSSATLTLGEVNWQKKLSIPEVSLKASEPITSEELNPLAFFAEGAVVNNSPYDLSAVRIVFLLFDQNNKAIGVSQRDEFTIPAFGRRAYKQQWPGLYQADVRKVQVIATTNTLDSTNVKIQGTGEGTTNDREVPREF
jgi:hypothetical protein